jgi:hypothetical protein
MLYCRLAFLNSAARKHRISPVPGLLRQSGANCYTAEFVVADQQVVPVRAASDGTVAAIGLTLCAG